VSRDDLLDTYALAIHPHLPRPADSHYVSMHELCRLTRLRTSQIGHGIRRLGELHPMFPIVTDPAGSGYKYSDLPTEVRGYGLWQFKHAKTRVRTVYNRAAEPYERRHGTPQSTRALAKAIDEVEARIEQLMAQLP